MKNSSGIKKFKMKLTDLRVARKKLFKYLFLSSDDMEISIPFCKEVKKEYGVLRDAFDSKKSIEIEGKMANIIPLYRVLYRGDIKINGRKAYNFVYGHSRTFPRGHSLKFEYVGNR